MREGRRSSGPRLSLALILGSLLSAETAVAQVHMTTRQFLQICQEHTNVCTEIAEQMVASIRQRAASGEAGVHPYCLRPSDDDAKTLVGLVQWYFGPFREEIGGARAPGWSGADSWPTPWRDLLDMPYVPYFEQVVAPTLMAAAYPCPGVDYPENYVAIMGYVETEGRDWCGPSCPLPAAAAD